MTASVELMSQLHEAIGTELLKRIQSGQATASEFAQAIKFLKDNGIEALPTGDNTLSKLEGSLKDSLPFSVESDFTH